MWVSSLLAASSGLVGVCSAKFLAVNRIQTDPSLKTSSTDSCDNVKPQGYTCGIPGTVSKPGQVSSNPGLTSDAYACRDACLKETNCLSFSFEPDQTCNLYSKLIKNMGFTEKRSGPLFYSRSCFSGSSCPTPANCPAEGGPANQNPIFQPGDFEAGNWGCWRPYAPYTTKGCTYGIVSPGNGGSKYGGEFYLPTNNEDNEMALAYTYSHFTVGQIYTVSMDIKMEDDQCDVILTNDWAQPFAVGQYEPGVYDTRPPNKGWNTYTSTTIPFLAATETFLSADCYGNPHNGTETTIRYQVDNIKIQKTGSVTYTPDTKPAGANLVVNGDFATKKLKPFYGSTPGGTAGPSKVQYNAKYKAAQITLTNNNTGSTISLDQDLSKAIKNAPYSFSVDVMYDQGAGVPDANTGCAAFFQFGTAFSGNILVPPIGSPQNPGAGPGKWVTLKGVQTAPKDNGKNTLTLAGYCLGDGKSDTANFYFRNIKVFPLTKT